MTASKRTLRQYYGKHGSYLQEHEQYLRQTNLAYDVAFLERALTLKKSDDILDVACGQGRHAWALAAHGYRADGVDFSRHLVTLARTATTAVPRVPQFFIADVERLRLNRPYRKLFWFFSDLAGIKIPRALHALSANTENGGLLLLDTDNIFRIVGYLQRNPSSGLRFDAERLELIDSEQGVRVPYPTLPLWKAMLADAGFSLRRVFGSYALDAYSVHSQRLILVAKKKPRP